MDKEQVKTIGLKLSKLALYFILYILLLVATYVIVGFVSNDWHPSWLIIVIGALGGVCVVLGIQCKKLIVQGKATFARLTAVPIVAIFQICVYLILSLCSKRNVWAQSWLILLLIPLDVALADIATCFLTLHRISKIDVLGVILFTSVAVYLGLAVLEILPFHPYWLIIVGGVIIDVVLGIIFMVNYQKKNR